MTSTCDTLGCEHLVPNLDATFGVEFECPECHKRSGNPFDIRAGYCAACHKFVTDPHLTFRPDLDPGPCAWRHD